VQPGEGWRNVDVGALGGVPPDDDLADVLRPISPDGSYSDGPGPYPPPAPAPRSSSAEELAQAVRRAERLAAEARAAAERHGAPPDAPAPGDSGWSVDRFREGLGGGPHP
jgi:hypothetical protein